MKIDAIAFDADDTLWHTEPYYRETERNFTALLSPYGVSAEAAMDVLHRIEVDNLAYFGYGIRGFILSLIETAIQVTGEKVRATDIQAMVELGRKMTSHEIRLLEGVQETLTRLQDHRLLLVTKGDTLDQESKLQRSGLAGYFPSVEILVDKTEPIYAAMLARHAIDPAHFLMIGNSLRSDIAPVLALGAYAVYVPYANGWAHESAADLPEDRSRFFEISNLLGLPDLLEKIEAEG